MHAYVHACTLVFAKAFAKEDNELTGAKNGNVLLFVVEDDYHFFFKYHPCKILSLGLFASTGCAQVILQIIY